MISINIGRIYWKLGILMLTSTYSRSYDFVPLPPRYRLRLSITDSLRLWVNVTDRPPITSFKPDFWCFLNESEYLKQLKEIKTTKQLIFFFY